MCKISLLAAVYQVILDDVVYHVSLSKDQLSGDFVTLVQEGGKEVPADITIAVITALIKAMREETANLKVSLPLH